MSKKLTINDYLGYAIALNDKADADVLLLADTGLPVRERTAAHGYAVDWLAKKYGVKPQPLKIARKEKDAWMSPRTFERGTREQRALSRCGEMISGAWQNKARMRAKARTAHAALEADEKKVASIEANFEKIEKLAARDGITGAEKAAIKRHAKFLLNLIG